MERPGDGFTSADLVGAAGGVVEELTGSLRGWKRKLSGRKEGTPRKKDVTFVAPDGEEVKNKRQLDKYLKAHPGTAIASDCKWSVPAAEAMTPNGTRRRSARLTLKGHSLTEAINEERQSEEPPLKRARKCLVNGTESKVDAPVKDKRPIKTSSEEGIQILSNQSKEGENGEANENHEESDMDIVKVEAPAVEETKAVTVKDAINCTKIPDSVIKEDAEKVIGEDISKSKEVESPQPEGIHALIQAVPNPQEEEIFMIPEAIVGLLV